MKPTPQQIESELQRQNELTDRRNQRAMEQIKIHPQIKRQSRAYQEGGAFAGREDDCGDLVDRLYRGTNIQGIDRVKFFRA